MKFFLSAYLIYVVLAIAGLIGWVLNIVKLVAHIHDPLTALEVFRVVGVAVAPLGAVLGFVS